MRIELRIGVHQGDIVVEEGDIFGNGVNVVARLKGLAEPGRVRTTHIRSGGEIAVFILKHAFKHKKLFAVTRVFGEPTVRRKRRIDVARATSSPMRSNIRRWTSAIGEGTQARCAACTATRREKSALSSMGDNPNVLFIGIWLCRQKEETA
jgi:hypothetical protein